MNHKKRKAHGSPSGRLRIVAGKWRSRLLPVVVADGLRPTAERIRETLFNWLAPVIEGAHCLDLFAGTGALGLEALSRGATSALLIDNSHPVITGLRTSIDTLQAHNATVLEADALWYLQNENPRPFDIVFLDPPFAADLNQELCRLLNERGWLAENARVYFEQRRSQDIPALPESWQLLKEKTAGNVRYSLVQAGNVNGVAKSRNNVASEGSSG